VERASSRARLAYIAVGTVLFLIARSTRRRQGDWAHDEADDAVSDASTRD